MFKKSPLQAHFLREAKGIISVAWQKWFNDLVAELNYVSSCRVHKNTVTQALTATVATQITWVTAQQDTQSEVNLSTNLWKANAAGDYLVSYHVGVEVGAAQDFYDLEIYHQGASVRYKRFTAVTASNTDLELVTKIENIAVNDELKFYITNHSNNDTINGDIKRTYFEIYRLGASS